MPQRLCPCPRFGSHTFTASFQTLQNALVGGDGGQGRDCPKTMSVQVSSASSDAVRPRDRVHSRRLFAPAHLRTYLLLLLCTDHVLGLVFLCHGGGPGLNHLLCLRHNLVPGLLLLYHGGHNRRGCDAIADGVEHLGLNVRDARGVHQRLVHGCSYVLLFERNQRGEE